MATESDWKVRLTDRLGGFVATWSGFRGTELAGAQDFLRSLLDIYAVSYQPGTVFEQHPIQIRQNGTAAAQGALFGSAKRPEYTRVRMDLYLPKVCVWEMKGPSEKDLEKHLAQLLGCWARMQPRWMVLCKFHEFWTYDTNEADGQLTPKFRIALKDLPKYGDALLFLRGEEPNPLSRSVEVTAEVARLMGRLVRELRADASVTERGRDKIAKFVLECVFAMFAEDTDLVPVPRNPASQSLGRRLIVALARAPCRGQGVHDVHAEFRGFVPPSPPPSLFSPLVRRGLAVPRQQRFVDPEGVRRVGGGFLQRPETSPARLPTRGRWRATLDAADCRGPCPA